MLNESFKKVSISSIQSFQYSALKKLPENLFVTSSILQTNEKETFTITLPSPVSGFWVQNHGQEVGLFEDYQIFLSICTTYYLV